MSHQSLLERLCFLESTRSFSLPCSFQFVAMRTTRSVSFSHSRSVCCPVLLQSQSMSDEGENDEEDAQMTDASAASAASASAATGDAQGGEYAVEGIWDKMFMQ